MFDCLSPYHQYQYSVLIGIALVSITTFSHMLLKKIYFNLVILQQLLVIIFQVMSIYHSYVIVESNSITIQIWYQDNCV